MKNRFIFIALLGSFLCCCKNVLAQQAVATSYAHKVNTLVGTKGTGWAAGYTYPGATYPFGMVQFTRSYFSKESGFGINQLSGGGCDHMGNFPVAPLKGDLTISPENIIKLRLDISKEQGIAGYYNAVVNDDINSEFTVTQRTGMARFTYPASENRATIAIGGGVAGTDINIASIFIRDNNSCEGYAEGGSFCGITTPFKVYFVAEFDTKATAVGSWKEDQLKAGSTFSEGKNSGVYFTFDVANKKNIQYKVGVSYVSVDNARENLQAENKDWSFDNIKNNAITAWDKYLSKIEVKGENEDRLTQFYTHLYHVLIHPNVCSDVNGEYMGADFKVHRSGRKVYTSFSNWDTYRTQSQLLAMLAPDVMSDVVVSHQQFANESGGGFPRWVMANIETGVMNGDPSCLVIANAYAFGARNYDTRSILKIMEHGGSDPTAHSQKELTRPGLQQYKDKGYYNASIHLEYANADFAISRFAVDACNNEPVNWYYSSRAQSWRNLYNPQTKWLNSRNADGTWKDQREDWRESTYKNYFWMVPYNLKELIDTIGGKKAAEERLDDLFKRLDASYNDEWYAAGNEPSFQIPWIYNWAGAPYKTQAIIRKILDEQYSSKINGLPGNDDLGSMGAWYVFACAGLFPEIPAIGGFSINSPIFNSIVIHLKKGDLIINGGSEKNIYIQSLNVDGKPYKSTWLPWEKVENGAKLDFKLSNTPDKKWGTEVEPPSFR